MQSQAVPVLPVIQGSQSLRLKPVCGTSLGEGEGTPLQYSCLENAKDGGAWWAAVHGVAKSRTQLNDFPFTFHFHASEKETTTHSSVLAWRIPGTEEPGWLQSMGLQSRTRLKRLSSSSSSGTSLSLHGHRHTHTHTHTHTQRHQMSIKDTA